MNTSGGESWGELCPLLPLPLTDGSAKTKQGPGLSPVYRGNHPLHQKSNVVRDLFSRGGWRAGQEKQVGGRKQCFWWMMSHGAGMVGKQLKRSVIKEQSLLHNGSGSPIVRGGRELMQGV